MERILYIDGLFCGEIFILKGEVDNETSFTD